MSKKSEFLNFVDELLAAAPSVAANISDEARDYLAALRVDDTSATTEAFTENGKKILKFLQDNPDTEMWKARDIAEGLFVPSRSVSGACRKLVTDGYVEKLGQDPAVYMITEKGKKVII
jgi:DNA-binding MarR family transcriptional regulator